MNSADYWLAISTFAVFYIIVMAPLLFYVRRCDHKSNIRVVRVVKINHGIDLDSCIAADHFCKPYFTKKVYNA